MFAYNDFDLMNFTSGNPRTIFFNELGYNTCLIICSYVKLVAFKLAQLFTKSSYCDVKPQKLT